MQGQVFILLFTSILITAHCKIVPQINLTKRWLLIENVLRAFIGDDQASISVFEIDNDVLVDVRKDLLHKALNSIRPVFVYDGLDCGITKDITDMGGDLDNPITSKTYVAMSTSTILIEKNLKFCAKINTNAKWIFTLIEVTSNDVEALLIKAWQRFKMANILITYSDLDRNLYVKSYNPFQLKGEQHHGEFWTESVEDEKLEAIYKQLDRIFERKVRNLQNYPLKAVRFPKISEQDEILDSDMKKIFETVLNTNFTVFESTEVKFVTTKYPNGSFTGILREIEDGQTDIILNNRLLVSVNSSECAFLSPASATDMKYLIDRVSPPTNLMHFHVTQVFGWRTRFAYLATLLIVGVVWHLLNILRAKIYNKNQTGNDSAVLYSMLIGVQSSAAIDIQRRAPSYQRILIASLLIFSLITCNTFQGVIVKTLSHPKKSVNINTLEDLLKSDLNLTALISVPDLFKPNEDGSNVNQIQKRLHDRQTVDTELSENQAGDIFREPNQAVLMRNQYATDMVSLNFHNETGDNIYHIVNESPISFYLTYIVPKSSPFITTLNGAILSAREFGFLSFVNMKIKNYLDMNRMKRYMKNSMNVRPSSAITMGNMRNIFIFYLVCITVSFIVFLIEILYKKLSTQRPTLPFVH